MEVDSEDSPAVLQGDAPVEVGSVQVVLAAPEAVAAVEALEGVVAKVDWALRVVDAKVEETVQLALAARMALARGERAVCEVVPAVQPVARVVVAGGR